MPKTIRGIYHNLKESTYTTSNGEVVFFFSSVLYLNKFMDGYKQHREIFNKRIEKAIQDNVLNMETMSDIEFYKQVEKRGFHARVVSTNGYNWVTMKEDEIHRFAIRKMLSKDSREWETINLRTLRSVGR